MRSSLPERRSDEFDLILETNGMISAARVGRLFMEFDADIRERLGDPTAYFEIVAISSGSLFARLRLICNQDVANAAQVGGFALAIVTMLGSCTGGMQGELPSTGCATAAAELVANDNVLRMTVECGDRVISVDRSSVTQNYQTINNSKHEEKAISIPENTTYSKGDGIAAWFDDGQNLSGQIGKQIFCNGLVIEYDATMNYGEISLHSVTVSELGTPISVFISRPAKLFFTNLGSEKFKEQGPITITGILEQNSIGEYHISHAMVLYKYL